MTGPQEPEPELGEVEWLGGGPAEPGHQPRIPRAVWYALVGVVVVAVVIALTVSRHHSTPRAARPTPTRTTPSPSPTPSTPSPDPPTTSAAVTVRNLGHPLLDVPRGVEVFARGGDTVLRIELATGRITRTTGTELVGGGPVSMVATRHELLLMAGDAGSGLVIRDGRPPRPLQEPSTRGSVVLQPGPDPDHAWLITSAESGSRADLVGPDGRPTGPTIPSGGDAPDGTGNLVRFLTGGAYLARPGFPLQRITSGTLRATGPTRWLTEECDDRHHCTLDAVDRDTGEHHVLKPTSDQFDPLGAISPDGAVAATVHLDNEHSTGMLQLIDLATGAVRVALSVTSNQDYSSGPLAWTPDGRWLLTIDPRGRVIAVDRAGHTTVLTGDETLATELALRVQ